MLHQLTVSLLRACLVNNTVLPLAPCSKLKTCASKDLGITYSQIRASPAFFLGGTRSNSLRFTCDSLLSIRSRYTLVNFFLIRNDHLHLGTSLV